MADVYIFFPVGQALEALRRSELKTEAQRQTEVMTIDLARSLIEHVRFDYPIACGVVTLAAGKIVEIDLFPRFNDVVYSDVALYADPSDYAALFHEKRMPLPGSNDFSI